MFNRELPRLLYPDIDRGSEAILNPLDEAAGQTSEKRDLPVHLSGDMCSSGKCNRPQTSHTNRANRCARNSPLTHVLPVVGVIAVVSPICECSGACAATGSS
jgi:hypothetical protein